ncbi:dihydrofolate reductase family protein [Haladaptatus halobius]|uniref:dihydrofolate reductase family protein n=1 Tax=Haladaptatus halobius TaxID=2884875 RepID=UPI001D0B0E4B|nr:dihydrofolate reductase family protein [Haladaptatus halobius]
MTENHTDETTRRVVVSEFLSLDGTMQADKDRDGGFKHSGWQLPYFDDVYADAVSDGLSSSDALLLGRKTYEVFAAYWPTATEEEEFADLMDNSDKFADLMNNINKFVASRTLDEVEWQNSTLLEGDAAEAVAELKRQTGGDLRVMGSGELVQTLMQHDLVDQYHLMIHPLILGSGKRLFREGNRQTDLELLDTTTTGTGVVILTYQVVK